ncbi:hypothetical protein [Brevundimonas sp. Bb-A]|uniref:hypothetical protein n=1 Tax=Brevundimonas sp. Bb-A TaxID=2560058 RepID=UPI00128F2DBD|nr:hypothetical protein [Brevundimonas sp. Bb-A]QFU31193.1 hypothetical protein BSP_05915 [Brevundimonas sp. Bb-A]
MRPVLLLSSVLFAALMGAGAAAAQVATTSEGLRYLSWPGKPPVARGPDARVPARASSAQTTAPRATLAALPLARLDAPASTAVAARRGLTPASDWLSPAVASQPVSQPRPYEATTPQPAPVQVASAQPEPVQAPVVQPPVVKAPVVQAAADRSAPAPQNALQPTPQADAPGDPMAPRRDAPIFRLTQTGMAAAAPAATPPVQTAAVQAEASPLASVPSAAPQGARFYSVHRQAGHRPDPIPQAQPVYLDALPVEMSQTPSSADLAQPDGPPALIRNRDGSVRAAPPSAGGSDAVDERS